MELKNLVPTVELCNLIPVGEFENCVLWWTPETPAFACGKNGAVEPKPMWLVKMMSNPRLAALARESYGAVPAPTLAEIMVELPPETTCDLNEWGVWYIINPNTESIGEKANDPATAAIRLWLKLKGIEE